MARYLACSRVAATHQSSSKDECEWKIGKPPALHSPITPRLLCMCGAPASRAKANRKKNSTKKYRQFASPDELINTHFEIVTQPYLAYLRLHHYQIWRDIIFPRRVALIIGFLLCLQHAQTEQCCKPTSAPCQYLTVQISEGLTRPRSTVPAKSLRSCHTIDVR